MHRHGARIDTHSHVWLSLGSDMYLASGSPSPLWPCRSSIRVAQSMNRCFSFFTLCTFSGSCASLVACENDIDASISSARLASSTDYSIFSTSSDNIGIEGSQKLSKQNDQKHETEKLLCQAYLSDVRFCLTSNQHRFSRVSHFPLLLRFSSINNN